MDAVRISLEPIRLRTIHVVIEGDTPLIIHKFSEKAKKQIQDKQGGKATQSTKKTIRKPEEEFNEARHTFIDEQGEVRDGVRAVAIKTALVEAGKRYMGIDKVDTRGDLHINCELVPIDGPPAEMDEDFVRLGGPSSPADIRYRPKYWPWSLTVPVTFKPDRLSEEQIVAMFAHAGFSVGLGEHRPQGKTSTGNNGRFSVKELIDA